MSANNAAPAALDIEEVRQELGAGAVSKYTPARFRIPTGLWARTAELAPRDGLGRPHELCVSTTPA